MSKMSIHSRRARSTAMLAATLAGSVVFGMQAGAETINVTLDAPADTYTVGDAVAIEVHATTSAILVGFGFDLSVGPELTYSGYDVGPAFAGVASTPDGDGIAGLSLSAGVDGADVLLGTARFDAVAAGDALIALSTTSGDLTEGFAQFGSGFFDLTAAPLALTVVAPQDDIPPVTGGGGSPPGVPEPTTVSLLAAGCLMTIRRRR